MNRTDAENIKAVTATRRSFLGRCLAGAVLSATRWLPMAEPVAVDVGGISLRSVLEGEDAIARGDFVDLDDLWPGLIITARTENGDVGYFRLSGDKR